ncbi:sensor histidine kinase [Pseudomonadota bacterium]
MKEIVLLIDNIFSYFENRMSFLAEKIMLLNDNDPDKVSSIIYRDLKACDKLRKSLHTDMYFDFVNSDGYATVTAIDGVLKNPVKIEAERREWLVAASREPWKLHFSFVDKGVLTGNNAIPFGYGVTDNKGKFLGIVTSGLKIEKFKERLKETIEEEYNFIVFDKKGRFVLQSDKVNEYNPDEEIRKKLLNIVGDKKYYGTLKKSININNVNYVFYVKSKNYPFIVLLGIDNKNIISEKVFQEKINSLLNNKQYKELFFVILTYYFRKKLTLERIKDDFIVQGNISDEIDDLVKRLDQIDSYEQLRNERNIQEEISKHKQLLLEQRESFFRGIMHDLRNPVANIKGIINFAQKEEGAHLDKREIIMIKQACDNMMSLVDNILIVAKMKSGNLELKKSVFDIKDLIDEVIEINRFNIEGKQLYIRKKIPEDTAELYNFFGDRQVMNRILTNLITNAVKFTDRGGITMSLYKDEKDNIIVSVIDTGRGIKEENLDHVFKEFGQAKTGKEREGTGIGLPIVKKFVEWHGGKLELKSEFGKGTEVRVILKPGVN